jgi:glycosyltransferase involved in cell wall biosynthesis
VIGKPRRLAVVVQRYGEQITGGSESLARAVATRLALEDEVTVFTTCAVDYVTWRNTLPPGESMIEGVRVVRFAVQGERDLDSFNRLSDDLYARTPTRAEELEWLRQQGPYVPELPGALVQDASRFDAVIFFTYLYYPTWAGLQAASQRSLLVPTTHDEPPLRFSIFREMFDLPKAFAFLTPPEESLVRFRFDLKGRPSVVAGIGVDLDEPTDVPAFRRRYGLDRPYVLYAGRIDAGKGCADLVDFFARYTDTFAPAPDLVLMGSLAMDLPQRSDVRYLGFVSETEKRSAMAGAEVVICPSPFESLSIVLLEALSYRVPVLVNRRSAVLEDHVLRSRAGLYYDGGADFVEALHRLRTDPALRAAMGASGRRYVENEYAWPAVLGRYRGIIEAL